MPPVTLHWYDAATGPKYRPPGIPDSEPLIGGPGAFGRLPLRPGASGPPGARGPGDAPAMPGAPSGGVRGGITLPAPGREGVVFVGEKGYMTTDAYGATARLLPLARHEAYQLPPQLLTRSPGHHRDWIRACKGGEPACSNFSVSGPFAEWIAMGVIALRVDGKLEWDSDKMRFANSPEANRLLHPHVRKGWSLT